MPFEASLRCVTNCAQVVARITADNLMLLNKVQHTEAKMEQAVREREVLRVDLNTNDKYEMRPIPSPMQSALSCPVPCFS